MEPNLLLDSYLKTRNTGIAAGERDWLAPLPNGKERGAKASAIPARSRWIWSGEGSPPDPKAPCPCGSSKRYKKCCMPR